MQHLDVKGSPPPSLKWQGNRATHRPTSCAPRAPRCASSQSTAETTAGKRADGTAGEKYSSNGNLDFTFLEIRAIPFVPSSKLQTIHNLHERIAETSTMSMATNPIAKQKLRRLTSIELWKWVHCNRPFRSLPQAHQTAATSTCSLPSSKVHSPKCRQIPVSRIYLSKVSRHIFVILICTGSYMGYALCLFFRDALAIHPHTTHKKWPGSKLLGD